MEALDTALTTALTTIKGDILTTMASVLPSALAVGGAVIAITLGWRFFKRIGK